MSFNERSDLVWIKQKCIFKSKLIRRKKKIRIGDKIHNQLVGNQDYVDCRIVLNIDEPYMVSLWIDNNCVNPIPEIRI